MMHTSLCGAIKKTLSLSHMKDMAQLEECSGRSAEGGTAEEAILSVLNVLITLLMLKSQFTQKYIFLLNDPVQTCFTVCMKYSTLNDNLCLI